ncbi:MAG TPA: sialate O-acetylesterase [Rariglobus sp.]
MPTPLYFRSLLTFSLVTVCAQSRADVSLPAIFGSNMVLQRDVPVPVWGWADAGETVRVEIDGQSVSTVTGADGHWHLKLAPLSVRESGDLVVSGKNTLTFTNVAVGEVWYCSGQSNMASFLSDQGEQAVAEAEDPQLRLYKVSSLLSAVPLDNRPGLNWQPSTPKSAARFSGQAYYFGRTLRRELNVPVGVIAAAIGGSRIEPWISAEVSAATPELQSASDHILKVNTAYLDQLATAGLPTDWLSQARQSVAARHSLPALPPLPKDVQEKLPAHPLAADKQQPSTLYNGLVHHLMGFPVKGVIWQQGFSNQADAYGYIPKLKALVDSWRRAWGADIPVYYVQYPATQSVSAEFRDVQFAILKAIPNTGMVTCSDVSTDLDLHPKNKHVVGPRIAMMAMNRTYGKPLKADTGPLYQSMAVEGAKIRVTFDQVGSGLASRDGKPLDWFEIAAATGAYVPAQAEIDGGTVLVWSPEITHPAKVRFAWNPIAVPNLMNQELLPASVFRSHREP